MPYKEGNKWRGTVKVKGKRQSSLHNTKRLARKWEVETRKALRNTGALIQQSMGLNIFCSKYLDAAKQRMSPKVLQEKLSVSKRICNELGKHTPVDEITVDMVASYLERQAIERSNNASNADRKNILAMWSWGVKRLDLPSNPVAKIDKLPHDVQKQYTPPEKDVLKVLAVATREERVFLDCYLHTAARRSEIFRWDWNEDINFDKREVRLGTRKTKDGSMEYEWLPMNDDLYNSLMWLWKNKPHVDSPYVFVNTAPGPYYGQPFVGRRRFLKGLCKRAGVEPFGFHALRRYVASIFADKHKVSAKTIQRILRHKNLSTTEKYLENIHHDLRETMGLLTQENGKVPEKYPKQQEQESGKHVTT